MQSGDVFTRAADGIGEETPLFVNTDYKWSHSWSEQGLIFVRTYSGATGGTGDIWLYSIDDPDNPVPFIESEAAEDLPFLSPDGRFLAYTSDRSGRSEVYVTPYPGGPEEYEWKVTTDGGTEPRWPRDGMRLFYETEGRIMVAPVIQTDPFRTGTATVFFDTSERFWDVGPDGSYIVAIEDLAPPRPRLVLNWFEELKQRVPTGR